MQDGRDLWWHDLVEDQSDDPGSCPCEPMDSEDLLYLLYTSGTTAKPKGIAHTTAGYLVGVAATHHYIFDIKPNSVFWCAADIGWVTGHSYIVYGPLCNGTTGVIYEGTPDFPDRDRWWSIVERYKVDTLYTAPTAIRAFMKWGTDWPQKHDLSSLRLAVTGAATVPVEMIRRMASELTFTKIVTGYGLTESTGVVTMCRHTDDPETIANTAGRPIPDVEVRTVDETGNDVPTGRPGEVVVRGYNVMAGYIGDPEATAAAIDADGWLHTGDIGVFDRNGNLKITDRVKDMFIVGGFNAYPAEIENMIMEHPAVGQVAVVGVPDQRLGEVATAFVVPRAGGTIDEAGLIAWCRGRMANYKVPRSVRVVDALPLNASGKVLKYVLREQAGTQRPSEDEAPVPSGPARSAESGKQDVEARAVRRARVTGDTQERGKGGR